MTVALVSDLRRIVGMDHVTAGAETRDATEFRGLSGRADAFVRPGSAREVASVLGWCYDHDVPVVPRGGGTGYAGGAVPITGGVLLALDRLTAIRALDPQLWRMHAEAGLSTRHLQRLARESGLYFPPDPGAAEQSQLGGNIATNAGGPHAFKYGTTGAWVTGIEAVVPPGDLISLGGPIRKDVAGYDLLGLLVGSEGTLGIVTAAWLRLIPAPEARMPLVVAYGDTRQGCAAIEAAFASGVVPAALEYVDGGALDAAGPAMPYALPEGCRFLVVAEADGSYEQARTDRDELAEALAPGASIVRVLEEGAEAEALWRWREGVSLAVAAQRGGKVSEDIVVPLDRLADAIEGIVEIGARHGLEACSWGHAGDGNLHATFMVERDGESLHHADCATIDLFSLALELGGSITGEHGIGVVKAGQLRRQWSAPAVALHDAVKAAFDPKDLLNPGKKLA